MSQETAAMSHLSPCPKCGQPLPADALAGLCPKCLIQAGIESAPDGLPSNLPNEPRGLPPGSRNFEPASVAALADKFPQLEILELLGQGGMGSVYKARQKGLDRLVAVKVLPPEIGQDGAFAERFAREAKALARLSHNHIVSVYDFGQADGLFYIVMEYVDGVNLRQTIQTGKLAPEQALAIVPQICEALQFAHDEGIVHRDIKPENILVDKRGRVKIADFGLAKLLGQDAGDHLLTATHQVMGTLRYMAPEQMQGSREVDHRADIYSLGVIFYELLTGELPMGKFAAPSKKVQIDVRLDEIVLRALEQDPEQRYQQASEVRTDVQSVSSSVAKSENVQLRGSRDFGSDSSAPLPPSSQTSRSKLFVATSIASFLISLGGITNVMLAWGEIYNSVARTWHVAAGIGWWQGMLAAGLFAVVELLVVCTFLLKPIPLWRPLLALLAGAGVVLAVSSYLLEMKNGTLMVQPLLDAASWGMEIDGRRPATVNDANVAARPRGGPYITLAMAASLLLVAAIELGAILKHRGTQIEGKKQPSGPVSWPAPPTAVSAAASLPTTEKLAPDGLVFRRLSLFNGLFWLVWSGLLSGLQWGYLADAKWYFQKELPYSYLSGAWYWVSLMFAFFFVYWWYLLAKVPTHERSLADAWRTMQTPDRRAIRLWIPGAAFLAVWIGATVLTMSFYDDDMQSTTLTGLIIAAPLVAMGSCLWAYRMRASELVAERQIALTD